MTARLKDIAQKLNLSISTVSRALNHHPKISKQTKKKVFKAAQELHYLPDGMAHGLRTHQSHLIGVVTPQITHPLFSRVLTGIEQEAYRHGYNVIVCNTNEKEKKEKQNIDTLLKQRVDGILISVTKESKEFSHLEKVQKHGIPLVFYDQICEDIITSKVIGDDYKGAYLMTSHLIQKGYRKILHYTTSPNLLIGYNKIKGFKAALKDGEISIEEDGVITCDNYMDALKITPEIIKKMDPDAIFCVNDSTAYGAIHAVQKMGYNVPKDLAIVGFNNNPVSQFSNPPLTTIKRNSIKMGTEATRLLLKKIEAPHSEVETIVIPPKLLKRESC